MSVQRIPIFQSDSDKSNYERKTALSKMLINELWPHMDQELAWCATLDEFLRDVTNPSLIAEGFTPVLSNLQDAEETYVMLARKEFSRLSSIREASLSERVSSGSARSTPVVAMSYKHMKCNDEGRKHMTITKRKFLDIFYRVFQFFQYSTCKSISHPAESSRPTGLVLWFDRMLLVSQIPTSAAAWVDRGLAPYMATMSFISCVTHDEEDFEHFTSEKLDIDANLQDFDSRVGDVLSSLWIAIEFDLSYGATSVLSSADSMVWTNVMYSLPDIDTADKHLQTQVRNMLARSRCSIAVSGYAFNESMLNPHTADAKKLRLLDDESARPIVLFGNPQNVLSDAAEGRFIQLHEDLSLCAGLMSLMAGDHNFSRMPYPEDVRVMRERWCQAFERILRALDQTGIQDRGRILIDLFAPREFDNVCKGLDHTAERESLRGVGYVHLLERSTYWRPSFTDVLGGLLRGFEEPLQFIGILHCGCFRHGLSPRKSSDLRYFVGIEIFGSVIYPQRAVYICRFWSAGEDESVGRISTTVSGRCSRTLLMRFRSLLDAMQARKDSSSAEYIFARELSSLLVLHGKIIRFLLDYGCQDHPPTLCEKQSDWTYAQMMEGCRAYRMPLTLLLLHSLNTRVIHTNKCLAKTSCLVVDLPDPGMWRLVKSLG